MDGSRKPGVESVKKPLKIYPLADAPTPSPLTLANAARRPPNFAAPGDYALWALLDGWLTGLDAERFVEVLPLLRRTSDTFAPDERRQIGERARRGMRSLSGVQPGDGIVGERAARVVPVLRMILGTDEEQ